MQLSFMLFTNILFDLIKEKNCSSFVATISKQQKREVATKLFVVGCVLPDVLHGVDLLKHPRPNPPPTHHGRPEAGYAAMEN